LEQLRDSNKLVRQAALAAAPKLGQKLDTALICSLLLDPDIDVMNKRSEERRVGKERVRAGLPDTAERKHADRTALLRAHAHGEIFFQAEDGIRDFHVTGVQTCALPISSSSSGTRTSWFGRRRSRPRRSLDRSSIRRSSARSCSIPTSTS